MGIMLAKGPAFQYYWRLLTLGLLRRSNDLLSLRRELVSWLLGAFGKVANKIETDSWPIRKPCTTADVPSEAPASSCSRSRYCHDP